MTYGTSKPAERKLHHWEGLGSSWVSLGASWEGLRASWEGPEASWEGLRARWEGGTEEKKGKNGAFLLFGGSGPLPDKDEPPVQCTNGAIMTTTNEGERAPNKLVRELQTV